MTPLFTRICFILIEQNSEKQIRLQQGQNSGEWQVWLLAEASRELSGILGCLPFPKISDKSSWKSNTRLCSHSSGKFSWEKRNFWKGIPVSHQNGPNRNFCLICSETSDTSCRFCGCFEISGTNLCKWQIRFRDEIYRSWILSTDCPKTEPTNLPM